MILDSKGKEFEVNSLGCLPTAYCLEVNAIIIKSKIANNLINCECQKNIVTCSMLHYPVALSMNTCLYF